MKIRNLLTVLSLCGVIFLSGVSPVKASGVLPVKASGVSPVEVSAASPRAAICTKCMTGTLFSEVTYTKWRFGEVVACTHRPYGTDECRYRYVTTTTKCNFCYASADVDQYEEYWICNGSY